MRRWPATIRVFMAFRMNCIGCPIGGFHTLWDACEEHGLDPGVVLEALDAAARRASSQPLPSATPTSLCGSSSTMR
jgi:hybrid cluster-associated redox disulfide protein